MVPLTGEGPWVTQVTLAHSEAAQKQDVRKYLAAEDMSFVAKGNRISIAALEQLPCHSTKLPVVLEQSSIIQKLLAETLCGPSAMLI
ncbi:hypothetical protein UY3_12892 [Chelonia mydas]|uniref:Uncharacterized protein n=1 Tax=Chelonia mydas TaxID=8469 RepID=M7BCX9_CHEMY|nr:hypothetical protein UY3_12892 [Chelonia mydas]